MSKFKKTSYSVGRTRAIKRLGLAGGCALAIASTPAAYGADSDGDGISDSVEGYYQDFNNGFESPVISTGFMFVPEHEVPNWGTDASDGIIEIWQSNYTGVASFEGVQHAEINANEKAVIFLDVPTLPGTEVTWKVAHKGRANVDTATVSLGAPNETGIIVETMVTGTANWKQYTGNYTVPAGQTVTRFSFSAEDVGAVGNFIDAFELTTSDPDADGDGTPNYLDLDSDDDGIADSVETNADADADDTPNFLDLDSDNDSIPDSVEGAIDTDTDGKPDYLDLDSDADNIPDSVEGVTDADGDGIPDYLAPPVNTSNLDSDLDGIPDSTEGTIDTDGDGTVNANDTDSDDDGIPDTVEAGSDPLSPVDTDADGVFDYLDIDSDNDGILDADEGSADQDADGTPNYLDLDVDNDGILDVYEARASVDESALIDSNLDGIIDSGSFGSNGLADVVETAAESGEIKYTLADTDADGLADFMDLDSDNDSISDVVEHRQDDIDLDNLIDATPASYLLPPDQDMDSVPNFRDLDSDNDGLTDLIEANGVVTDADGDGRLDNFSDTDNDGIDDSVVASIPKDTDGDGLQNQLDLDSDQDSLPDTVESSGSDSDANGLVDNFVDADNDGLADALMGSPLLAVDTDSDGSPDYLDIDSDNDGTFDLVSAGNVDTNNDGAIDNFEDPDNDGFSGVNPNPVVSAKTGDLITGVSGGIGCSITGNRGTLDPLLSFMLLLASVGISRRKKS